MARKRIESKTSDFGTVAQAACVVACCGDVPTLETLAAVELLRKYFPELKVRVINVVDLMKLQPQSEHPHGLSDQNIEQLAINTIRTLSIDAAQAARSGHPGTPMALAPLVYTIWNRVLRFDPQDPIWPNRDRFVLSNGHASMLLWSILHLTQ